MIGFILSRASLAMRQYVNRSFRESGLTEVSMGFIGVLLSLYGQDGQTITELGEAVALEKSTMTGLLDRMVRAGLVTRETDSADRRALRIWLTERGRQVQPEIARVLEKSYRGLTRGIPPKNVEQIETLMAQFIENARDNHGG